MVRTLPRVCALVGLGLMLSACVPAGAQNLESFNFSSARGDPTVISCTAGEDAAQRARAAMDTLDAGFAQLEAQIVARTDAAFDGGPDFSSFELIRLSQRTGRALAQRIEAEQGCYLRS